MVTMVASSTTISCATAMTLSAIQRLGSGAGTWRALPGRTRSCGTVRDTVVPHCRDVAELRYETVPSRNLADQCGCRHEIPVTAARPGAGRDGWPQPPDPDSPTSGGRAIYRPGLEG